MTEKESRKMNKGKGERMIEEIMEGYLLELSI